MVALYPGGPRSRGPRGVAGADVCEVYDVATEVGVNVRSAGGGSDELKEDEDAERLDPDIAALHRWTR